MAEISSLLALITDDQTRQALIAQMENMFDNAPDEERLIQEIGNPTKVAVALIRYADSGKITPAAAPVVAPEAPPEEAPNDSPIQLAERPEGLGVGVLLGAPTGLSVMPGSAAGSTVCRLRGWTLFPRERDPWKATLPSSSGFSTRGGTIWTRQA